jgi:hypothetical protein
MNAAARAILVAIRWWESKLHFFFQARRQVKVLALRGQHGTARGSELGQVCDTPQAIGNNESSERFRKQFLLENFSQPERKGKTR